jgi:chemotaxis protein methyltransferase CheR
MSNPSSPGAAAIRDEDCVAFLQRALPKLRLRWHGFRKVHRQVCKRVRRRLNELGLQTLEQYRGRLASDATEWVALEDLCHITISRFYRDRHVFDMLGTQILPELADTARRENRAIRCWSAGCASGEEVYTLKILWDLDVQPAVSQATLEVIGTDADKVVLERATEGCYSRGSLKDVPAHWLAAFIRTDHLLCVRDVHREGVVFSLQDIRSTLPAGPFDLILCRNLVLTYFEPQLQDAMLDRIDVLLRAGGYLVVGAHEQLPRPRDTLVQIIGCREIFRKQSPGIEPRRHP